MLHLVRTALSRDLGGMGNLDLYKHSYIGTKHLIEQYVDSTVKTIEALVEKSGYVGALPEGLDHQNILDGLLQSRQSFGRSALLLSGGGTFGMMHAGVLKAMYAANLLPRIISGASAGSIICSIVCSRTDEEIPGLLDQFPYGDLAVFDQEGQEESISGHLKRLLTEGTWSDITHLIRVMREYLGDITFWEAYNRTRRICNISVSTETLYELPRLLNYITAPNVMLWSAVAASCSVPFVFSAAPLLVKDPRTGEHLPWNPSPQRWVDGSVDNDLPMTRLAEMFNVNHFVVSQVNPHVVPFLSKDDRLYSSYDSSRPQLFTASQDNPDWLYTLTALAKDEALHRLHFMTELGIFPNMLTKLRTILSQKYSGDINIVPEFSIQDLPRILKNPSVDFMKRACLAGERATWPKLSRIRDRCKIELAIDGAIRATKARVAFSQSQVDLRRLVTGSDDLGVDRFSTMVAPETGGHSSNDKARLRHHQRRSSGSTIQLLARRRKMLFSQDSTITDDETEEEELLELRLGRGVTGMSLSGRSTLPTKPRTRRSAKSQLHVSLSCLGPMTSPLPGAGDATDICASEFDFSRPINPQQNKYMNERVRGPDASASEEEGGDGEASRLGSPITFSESPLRLQMAASPRLYVVSPTTGDPETSDVHTSGADLDSHTDESVSDPEPYEQPWLDDQETTPQKSDNRSETSSPHDTDEERANPAEVVLADDEENTDGHGEDGLWD